jgi:electron transport complex protein RnfG
MPGNTGCASCTTCTPGQGTTPPAEKLGVADQLKAILVFIAVYMAVGVLVSLTYTFTRPVILKREAIAEQLANSQEQRLKQFRPLFPACNGYTELGTWTINEKTAAYFSIIEAGKPAGYVIESYGKGFSSLIAVLVGVDLSGTITGIDILQQEETPGMGDQITGDDFKKQFHGKKLDQLTVTTTDNGRDINAIAGATISSRAVTEDAVLSAVKFINEKVRGK